MSHRFRAAWFSLYNVMIAFLTSSRVQCKKFCQCNDRSAALSPRTEASVPFRGSGSFRLVLLSREFCQPPRMYQRKVRCTKPVPRPLIFKPQMCSIKNIWITHTSHKHFFVANVKNIDQITHVSVRESSLEMRCLQPPSIQISSTKLPIEDLDGEWVLIEIKIIFATCLNCWHENQEKHSSTTNLCTIWNAAEVPFRKDLALFEIMRSFASSATFKKSHVINNENRQMRSSSCDTHFSEVLLTRRRSLAGSVRLSFIFRFHNGWLFEDQLWSRSAYSGSD